MHMQRSLMNKGVKEMKSKPDLKKLQDVELAMLKEVVRICEKYNLIYYLSAGTFLGAVRHKGFIPWDDDADIRMPRPDYEKLLEVLQGELKSPYIVKHFFVDQSVHRYYLRINDPRVKLTRNHSITGEISNAWLDIFPLDGMPKNNIHNRCRQLHLLYRRMWLQISVFDEIITLEKKRKWYEELIIAIVMHTPIQYMVSYEKMWIKLDNAMKAYPVDDAEYYVNFMGMYKFKDMIPKSIYGSGAKYQFEDGFYNGPEDYDTFLKHLYGDYMKLPPIETRNKHMTEIASIEIDD